MSNTISLANYERLAPVLDDTEFAAMVGNQGLDIDGGPSANKMHIALAGNAQSGPQFDVTFGGKVPLHLTLDQLKALDLAQYKVAPRAMAALPPTAPFQQVGYQVAESALQAVRAHQDPSGQLSLLKAHIASLPGQGPEIARGFLSALSQEDRVLLARTKSGRDMLAQMAQLAGGQSADAVDAAMRTADLEGSKEFKRLDPDTKALAIEWLTHPMITNWPNASGAPVPGPNAVKVLCDLIRSPAFGAASPDERKALLLDSLERPGSDQLRMTLENLTGLDAYKALKPAQKIQAIDECAKVFERYHRASDPDVPSPRAFPYQEIAVIRQSTQNLEHAKRH
jgi:hypothetical protein